jgi:hypothetical protein
LSFADDRKIGSCYNLSQSDEMESQVTAGAETSWWQERCSSTAASCSGTFRMKLEEDEENVVAAKKN